MTITERVLEIIEKISPLDPIDYTKFDSIQDKESVAKCLSRLVQKGVLEKLKKGIFYKPQNTKFGKLKIRENQILNLYLKKDNKQIGYITGINMFLNLKLTTQMANVFEIATSSKKRAINIRGIKILFKVQKAPICSENIKLLQILDAVKEIKNIPGTSSQTAYIRLKKIILSLEKKEKKRLINLSKYYRIGTAVLIGIILEEECDVSVIRGRMNPFTTYNYQIKFDNSTEKDIEIKKKWKLKKKNMERDEQ